MKTVDEVRATLLALSDELLALKELDITEMIRELIQYGKDITPLATDEYTEENYVTGCISNAYIVAHIEEGAIRYRGSSDSLIVKGFIAVLCTAISGLSATAVVQDMEELVQDFMKKLDLTEVLTPVRANAFTNIVYKMISQARALSQS